MSIELHIDRIVLDGISLSRRERSQLRDDIAHRLSDLLAESVRTGWQTRRQRIASSSLAIPAAGPRLGEGIARSAYEAVRNAR
jgi:hypothetical protein